MPAYNYPIPTIVNIGYLSAVFGDRDRQKNKIFNGGTKAPDNNYPFLMHMETAILDWYNTHFPSNTDVPNVGNYVLGLCGNYLGAALSALGNAGGIVINPTTGNPINLAFYRADFIIGQAGSLMDAGDTSLTIALSGFMNNSVHFEYAGSDGSLIDTGGAYITGITYNPLYIIIHLNQPVVNGEIYEVWGVRLTAGTVAGGGGNTGLPVPLPLQRGKFLTNDGDNLIWDDTRAEFTAADFEPDGRTVINAAWAIFSFDKIEQTNLPAFYYVSKGDITPIDGGGVIFNDPEFDATQNPDWEFILYKEGT